jgi:aspartyl protease family protein
MPQQSVAMAGTQVSVPRSPDGHYYLNLEINGTPTRFMVDTGATDMVLSRRDASLAGLKLDSLSYTTRAMTANGMVQTARVRLDQVALAGIVDLSVSAVVNAGDMGNSLLGMTYLQRFNSIEISGNTLLLIR